MKTREKKAASPLEGLLPIVEQTAILVGSDGKTSAPSQFFQKLFECDDQFLRRRDQTGDIPKPTGGRRDIYATVQGVRRYDLRRADNGGLAAVSFDSMESCESATGIPKSFQQTAKSNGCPAFRGSRVYLADLLKWTFSQGGDGEAMTDWNAHYEKFKALNEEADHRERMRELVTFSEFQTFTQNFSALCFNALKRWRSECPRELEQRDRAFIKKALDEKYETTVTQFDAELTKLGIKNEEQK